MQQSESRESQGAVGLDGAAVERLASLIGEWEERLERKLSEWTTQLEIRLSQVSSSNYAVPSNVSDRQHRDHQVRSVIEARFGEPARDIGGGVIGDGPPYATGGVLRDPCVPPPSIGEHAVVAAVTKSKMTSSDTAAATAAAAARCSLDGARLKALSPEVVPMSLGVKNEQGFPLDDSKELNKTSYSKQLKALSPEVVPMSLGAKNEQGFPPDDSKELNKTSYSKQLKDMRTTKSFPVRSGIPSVRKFVNHIYFEYAIIVVWVIGAIFVGLQVQHSATRGGSNVAYTAVEYVCSMLFFIELVMRFLAFGSFMFSPGMRFWTVFDALLVLTSFIDIVMYAAYMGEGKTANASAVRILKMMRMSRALRLLRVLRFFGELRVMVSMIAHSFVSLCWLFLMLVAIIYFTSIIFTQGATDYREEHFGDGQEFDIDHREKVEGHYGSLMRTMYTLFKAMTGGINWGEVAEPLRPIGASFFLLFLLYIFCMIFSVLNIVTGVFVDSAIQIAQRDRDVLFEKSERNRRALISNLLCILEELDDNKDGIITTDEIAKSGVKDQLKALDIQVEDMESLVQVLDANGDGFVDIQEFVDGLQALHGEAKRSDVRIVMMHTRHMLDLMQSLLSTLGIHDATMERTHAMKRTRSRVSVRHALGGENGSGSGMSSDRLDMHGGR